MAANSAPDHRRVVVAISSSDSSGASGVEADLKVFAMHGLYGCSVITQVRAASSSGIRDMEMIPPRCVRSQLDSILSSFPIRAVKTGMLATRPIVQTVVQALSACPVPIVVDPEMVDEDGDRLITDGAVSAIRSLLLPCATIVTPNLMEASILVERPIRTLTEMKQAAKDLVAMGARAALIKGGHLRRLATDIYFDGKNFAELSHPRIKTIHRRGVGSILSGSLVARIAAGQAQDRAVRRAVDDVCAILRSAAPLGSGAGPADPLLARHKFGVGPRVSAKRDAEEKRRRSETAEARANSAVPASWRKR